MAWSFKSVPVFVPALLVLFVETASGQQKPPAAFNGPQPQVQVQQQPVNASRYPAHLTTSQRGSFGAIRQPDAAEAFSTASHSRPQQFSPVDSVAQQQQQFLPAPHAATQFHDGPEPMNVPLQPGAWGANEVYRGNADEQFLTQPAKIPAEQLRWSFNFRNAPWPVVLRTFARECGFSLQMAVEPAGEFTYFDENQYRVTEVLDIFNDNLMTCGQILVRDGQRLMLMNATADIPGNLIPFVPIHGIDALGRNELATVAIPLKNTDPLQAIEEIRQLQSPLGQVKALTNSGRVIVTDTGSYLRRMRDLLLGSGVAAGDGQAYVYQLRHAQADEVAKAVTDFLSQNSGLGGGIPPGDGGFSNGSSDVSQKVVAEKTTKQSAHSRLIGGNGDNSADR